MSASFSRLCVLSLAGIFLSLSLAATTLIPVSDRELTDRADVIVHGIVVASEVAEDAAGRPETVTVVEPLEVLKGHLTGVLVLRQLGGTLPDGRFFKMWGRPEYQPGHEVVVFAVSRPEGDFQTAELLLGKFEVQQDEAGVKFAVPPSVAGAPGVTIRLQARKSSDEGEDSADSADSSAPRHLEPFLAAIRQPAGMGSVIFAAPRGKLRSVVEKQPSAAGASPHWANIDSLWRWNNGAVAVWKLDGQANMTGGGAAEAANATAEWDAEPNSTIAYSVGGGGTNPIHLNALTSPCGWNTCLTGAGVIGCGGPGGGGPHTWRGETYSTITSGEVWLRSYCALNGFGSTITQSVLTHELGHTLGLGHSDQATSSHDVCRGDEDLAMMRSSVQNRTTLGTDDSDAVRWLYGDGGNSCTVVHANVAGDFNGDGSADILWQNTGGAVYAWLMNGTTVSSGVSLPTVDPSWSIAGTADFNGDGKTDILFHNTSGAVYVWLMNGTGVASGVSLPTTDPAWNIAGTGDFNGDGKPDILWRHTSGAVYVWLMNGTSVVSGVSLPSVDPTWRIAGTGDFNGDGKTDILWHNTSGLVYVWLMNGTSVASGVSLPTTDPSWDIAAVADLTGDGKPDVLWRHTAGAVYAWIMNGTTVASGASLPSVDTSWKIVGPK